MRHNAYLFVIIDLLGSDDRPQTRLLFLSPSRARASVHYQHLLIGHCMIGRRKDGQQVQPDGCERLRTSAIFASIIRALSIGVCPSMSFSVTSALCRRRWPIASRFLKTTARWSGVERDARVWQLGFAPCSSNRRQISAGWKRTE